MVTTIIYIFSEWGTLELSKKLSYDICVAFSRTSQLGPKIYSIPPKDPRFRTLILTPALVLIFWYWGIIRNPMLRIWGGGQEGSVYFTNKFPKLH